MLPSIGKPIEREETDMKKTTIAAAMLTGWLLTGAVGSASAQSFACMGRLSIDELAVCDNASLRDADERVAAAYTRLLDILKRTDRGFIPEVRQHQRDFLAARKACRADVACIQDAYDEQYTFLRRMGNNAQNQ